MKHLYACMHTQTRIHTSQPPLQQLHSIRLERYSEKVIYLTNTHFSITFFLFVFFLGGGWETKGIRVINTLIC